MAFKSKKPEAKPEPKPAPEPEKVKPEIKTLVETVMSGIGLPMPSAPKPVSAPASAPAPAQGCGSCRHWHKPDPAGLGRCRRYPPSRGEHPVTQPTEVCGEFAARV